MSDSIERTLGVVVGKLEVIQQNQENNRNSIQALDAKVDRMDVSAATDRAVSKAHRGYVMSFVAVLISIGSSVVAGAFQHGP